MPVKCPYAVCMGMCNMRENCQPISPAGDTTYPAGQRMVRQADDNINNGSQEQEMAEKNDCR